MVFVLMILGGLVMAVDLVGVVFMILKYSPRLYNIERKYPIFLFHYYIGVRSYPVCISGHHLARYDLLV